MDRSQALRELTQSQGRIWARPREWPSGQALAHDELSGTFALAPIPPLLSGVKRGCEALLVDAILRVEGAWELVSPSDVLAELLAF